MPTSVCHQLLASARVHLPSYGRCDHLVHFAVQAVTIKAHFTNALYPDINVVHVWKQIRPLVVHAPCISRCFKLASLVSSLSGLDSKLSNLTGYCFEKKTHQTDCVFHCLVKRLAKRPFFRPSRVQGKHEGLVFFLVFFGDL